MTAEWLNTWSAGTTPVFPFHSGEPKVPGPFSGPPGLSAAAGAVSVTSLQVVIRSYDPATPPPATISRVTRNFFPSGEFGASSWTPATEPSSLTYRLVI